jgi:hypothetical protein
MRSIFMVFSIILLGCVAHDQAVKWQSMEWEKDSWPKRCLDKDHDSVLTTVAKLKGERLHRCVFVHGNRSDTLLLEVVDDTTKLGKSMGSSDGNDYYMIVDMEKDSLLYFEGAQ